ncbi:TIGR03086 family metal-binding protein [Pseudonocardia sp. CA-107938]|uniref:TIGR03086 family metal-binding protein n=1 Tax=Pseudonocardia sp. CA-107938 TaxID=3240021 RepID=UPI003D8ABD89
MSVPELFARSVAEFGARVDAVGGRWDEPSVLPGWTVRELVRHVVEEDLWAPPLYAGETIAEVGDRFAGDQLGADPAAAFRAAAAAAVDAVQEDGAMDRTVHLSFGDAPGHEYAMQLAADHLVHAWDLARSLGADDHLDATAVAAVADWFGGVQELYRQAGAIAEPVAVPAGADRQAQLIGMTGRTP